MIHAAVLMNSLRSHPTSNMQKFCLVPHNDDWGMLLKAILTCWDCVHLPGASQQPAACSIHSQAMNLCHALKLPKCCMTRIAVRESLLQLQAASK